MIAKVVNANALNIPLPNQSVQCVITSPPYFGLRDYGHDGQIGLEETPDAYVEKLVCVFREVWRVLKDDGVLWLNLGDSYSGNGGRYGDAKSTLQGRKQSGTQGASRFVKKGRAKDLIGIPWRVAFALQADGWYLRQDIIWHKPNPMPESVTDRCTKSHEYVFLLTKNARYFYDHEAIKEPSVGSTGGPFSEKYVEAQLAHGGKSKYRSRSDYDTSLRNRRSVWNVATRSYSGAHFATFPPDLVEPMVLAGSRSGDWILDPFAGTATVGQVAVKHGRDFIGLEINPEYIELAKKRTESVQVALFSGAAFSANNGLQLTGDGN